VDLEQQTVTTQFQDRFAFEIDPFRKHCLLGGLDEIGLTLGDADGIAVYEKSVAQDRPWMIPAVA
ncbi:MAG: 3-isopropylmalate dehydratase small subunit, partial [Sphingobium sp.]|nr:3-isopropylmalate dehydratase small subunit [Sphingobium sp.]